MKHLDPDVIEQAARAAPSAEVAQHLSSCTECQGHVRRAKGRQRLLAGMKPYTLSDMAFRRVEARLEEAVNAGETSPSPWRWLWWAGAAVAAAMLAVVVVSGDGALPGIVKIPTRQVATATAPFHPLTVLARFSRGPAAKRRLQLASPGRGRGGPGGLGALGAVGAARAGGRGGLGNLRQRLALAGRPGFPHPGRGRDRRARGQPHRGARRFAPDDLRQRALLRHPRRRRGGAGGVGGPGRGGRLDQR